MVIDEAAIDALVGDSRFLPHWGWHDDHRDHEDTLEYRPAIFQNRAEFLELLRVIQEHLPQKGCVLQLGLGLGGSHLVFEHIYGCGNVFTVEINPEAATTFRSRFGNGSGSAILVGSSHDPATRRTLSQIEYDVLFIDADHLYDGVKQDFLEYAGLVRDGGIIAFHDALRRPSHDDVPVVWQFIRDLCEAGYPINMIGTEIGIAWMVWPGW